MKIIKEGTIPDTTYRTTCEYCGTLFEFMFKEAASVVCTPEGDLLYVDCPLCKHKNFGVKSIMKYTG